MVLLPFVPSLSLVTYRKDQKIHDFWIIWSKSQKIHDFLGEKNPPFLGEHVLRYCINLYLLFQSPAEPSVVYPRRLDPSVFIF